MTIRQIFNLINNMGLRYAGFRFWYSIKKRIGLFKLIFPLNPPIRNFISLNEWKEKFRFWGITKEEKVLFTLNDIPDFKPYEEGYIPFFSAEFKHLGNDYDWLTNPDSGYRYNSQIPWWEINDYNKEAGDIKYVWEKSRFAFLYDIIRNDKHTGTDHSQWVFDQISSWIKANPINSGPNYKCSQEISLRILNWTYALNYYRNSANLTEALFKEVMNSIYWQVRHVYANINFSRIAVRNNHAITETLTLYIAGLYYSFFPEAGLWKRKGKMWFEKEVEYQIYEDGTFLQYSMNYHRIVIQLLTWAIKCADFMQDSFDTLIYDRAYKSLIFLYTCQDQQTGWLPNYGHNDGALFFKFSSCDFRDYRPQLNTLHYLLTGQPLYEKGDWLEGAIWFKAAQIKTYNYAELELKDGWHSFRSGGYYILREQEGLTFIRCGKHINRPAQADNLHLDIWYNGKNVLHDAGSYKYNTSDTELLYFMGSKSHNTVMLDELDQMKKGPRFIWYNWTQATLASVSENANEYIFEGEISAFSEIDNSIKHKRILRKSKNKPIWFIEDKIINKPTKFEMNQYWHSLTSVKFEAFDSNNLKLTAFHEPGWRSDYYGIKKETDQLVFVTDGEYIKTRIEIKGN